MTWGLNTLHSGSLTFRCKYNGNYINEAKLLTEDIMAGNGVVHVIDKVLLPDSGRIQIILFSFFGFHPPVTSHLVVPVGVSTYVCLSYIHWSVHQVIDYHSPQLNIMKLYLHNAFYHQKMTSLNLGVVTFASLFVFTVVCADPNVSLISILKSLNYQIDTFIFISGLLCSM